MDAPRPLTHDLLKTVIETLGGEVLHILINGLEKNTYFARIVLDVDGDTVEIDSRPSDAIALGVRVNAPIYVADEVMEQAGLQPEEEMSLTESVAAPRQAAASSDEGEEATKTWASSPTLSKGWTWTACWATEPLDSPTLTVILQDGEAALAQLRRFCALEHLSPAYPQPIHGEHAMKLTNDYRDERNG